uniref:Uncharacterized protein n=1 Tax=Leersia perrieri TaxID=77586 RepID=A0A0D9X0Y4_9ORYZ
MTHVNFLQIQIQIAWGAEHANANAFLPSRSARSAPTPPTRNDTMLQCQLPPRPPPRLFLAVVPSAASTAVSFTPRAAAQRGRGRRSKPKPKPKPKRVAFPPPPLRRLVSSTLRRLLPRPRPLTALLLLGGGGGGGWMTRRRRRGTPAEELAALVLSLALGDKVAVLADYWNASGLGQAVGVWAAVWRGRRRRGGGLRRLAALLLGIAFCALVCHFRGAALVDGLARTAGGRKLARIFLH